MAGSCREGQEIARQRRAAQNRLAARPVGTSTGYRSRTRARISRCDRAENPGGSRMDGEETRTTETGDRISVELLREYLTWTSGTTRSATRPMNWSSTISSAADSTLPTGLPRSRYWSPAQSRLPRPRTGRRSSTLSSRRRVRSSPNSSPRDLSIHPGLTGLRRQPAVGWRNWPRPVGVLNAALRCMNEVGSNDSPYTL